ncbi:uncharacterized protein si:dkey-106l3.7 isoform X2 [Thalassophryne amazonica]|uniref:uncharacterized protein si:dkey-106l3.7 isoform X2 n=1 Tax=Thalassophryne amazonica TaxID=390379 RepID=UPI00147254F0|nr:uncharacterized protein si:dkey-106l3.7 isoform X2 [Thalassophryne amazonica]
MNLYKSFGNLLETWVTEEDACCESEWTEIKNQESPLASSYAGAHMCSESVDSGVETASSDTSPATCYPELTDGADMDAVAPDGNGDKLTFDSPSESPVFYVPSSPLRVESHLKLEQALRRIDPKHSRCNSQADDREWSRSSLPPKRYSSVLVKGQNSGGLRESRAITELVPIRHMSTRNKRPLPSNYDVEPVHTTLKDPDQGEKKELSPGLSYLEQVCQMLENVAKQQMRSRALSIEMNNLRQHRPMQQPNDCQHDRNAAEDYLFSCEELSENVDEVDITSGTQQENNYINHKFLQRSLSETTLHSRMLKADNRGHCVSAYDLTEEEDQKKQNGAEAKMVSQKKTFKEPTKVQKNKPNRTWKIKIPSRREVYTVADNARFCLAPTLTTLPARLSVILLHFTGSFFQSHSFTRHRSRHIGGYL